MMLIECGDDIDVVIVFVNIVGVNLDPVGFALSNVVGVDVDIKVT